MEIICFTCRKAVKKLNIRFNAVLVEIDESRLHTCPGVRSNIKEQTIYNDYLVRIKGRRPQVIVDHFGEIKLKLKRASQKGRNHRKDSERPAPSADKKSLTQVENIPTYETDNGSRSISNDALAVGNGRMTTLTQLYADGKISAEKLKLWQEELKNQKSETLEYGYLKVRKAS